MLSTPTHRLCAIALLCAVTQAMAAPPVEPIPRVEVGSHTAMIRGMAVDAGRGRIVTVSDDKTARVWELRERGAQSMLRLRHTLRVPIDDQNEGRLSSVAVEPERGLVAVGGWTGWDWDAAASVHLFDIESGRMLRRLSGIPSAVTSLHFMAKGDFLAIGSGAGLTVFRVSDWSRSFVDPAAGRVVGIDDHADVGLAVSSLDGAIRVYDRRFRLARSSTLPAGSNPVTVAFTPDGSALAVGFIDAPAVLVLDSDSLDTLFAIAASDVPGVRNLPGVEWSADGSTLLAFGDGGPASAHVYRWGRDGRRQTPVEVAAGRVTAAKPLADGRTLVASEEAVIGIIDAGDRMQRLMTPAVLDFDGLGEHFRVSRDGTSVQFRPAAPGVPSVFSLQANGLTVPAGEPLLAPLTQHAGLLVENWQNVQVVDDAPRINGRQVEMEAFDISRAVAVSPSGDRALIGSDWGLYLFDRAGRQVWRRRTAEVVWQVNVTADGRFAVAALSDGTIRWYRMSDGAEVLATFVHPERPDWIAWVPQGYYVSSPGGDELIGWHINQGHDQAADFYRAVQFERLLFRPDIVAASLAAAGDLDVEDPDLRRVAPPRIELVSVAASGTERRRASLVVRIESESLEINDFGVYVNNLPVIPSVERSLTGSERIGFSRTIALDLLEIDNVVRIEAFNGVSMGLLEEHIDGPLEPVDAATGDLYILSVGVNAFEDQCRPGDSNPCWSELRGANDADELQRFFRENGRSLFDEVHMLTVTDHSDVKPTRSNVIEALGFIADAGPNDTVIVSLASHGLSDERGNYYFVPSDGAIEDALRVRANSDEVDSLISWTVFFDALRMAAGRRLLMVDTCESSDAIGNLDVFSLAKRSTSSNFALMAASQGSESSYETYDEVSQRFMGRFTYEVLSALRRGTDSDGDGYSSLREVFTVAFDEVQRKERGLQTPELIDPPPLGEMRLGVGRPGG